VAHPCNPSYSRDRDQEDHDLKPALANSSQDLILKISFTKKGWRGGGEVGVESNKPKVKTPVLSPTFVCGLTF
jgi:hypothetical protein